LVAHWRRCLLSRRRARIFAAGDLSPEFRPLFAPGLDWRGYPVSVSRAAAAPASYPRDVPDADAARVEEIARRSKLLVIHAG
jgi:hypothetical protein